MKMTKAERLSAAFHNCMTMMHEINMDYGRITGVTVNTRAKSRWGQCKTKFMGRNCMGDPVYSFSINISETLLEDGVPEEALNNTLIHEILHTCPNCQNHGAEWKKRAAIVKRELGYDIKRCESAREKGIPETIMQEKTPVAKYMVICTGCGQIITRNRMCSVIEHPSRWHCGICHGKLERIL